MWWGARALSLSLCLRVCSLSLSLSLSHLFSLHVQQFGEQVPGAYRFNEELVGDFIKTVPRESLTIATKMFPPQEGGGYKYSFELLEKAVDGSLARLGTKTIDLYYVHRMFPESVVTPEVLAADMKKMVEAGKIRVIYIFFALY